MLYDSATHRLAFDVSLSGPSATPVTVRWHAAGGAARPGVDYQPVSGVVTFQPGQTRAIVAVPVHRDRRGWHAALLLVHLDGAASAQIARGVGYGLSIDL